MIGTKPYDHDKITRASGSPVAEHTLASLEPDCDTAMRASFAVLAIVKPIVDAAFGTGGNK